jgi:protein-S-isoprenylcysteine O-methyltransferase Ste14
MTTIAFVLALAFATVGFGVRTAVQMRRTGDAGWRMNRTQSPMARLSHLTFGISPVVLLVGLVLDLVDSDLAGTWTLPPAVRGAGLGIAVLGLVLTVLAQLDLGSSWRIGVDEEERTELITGGLYRWMRNPIFTGMGLFLVGEALTVPNPWTAAAAVLGIVGMEVQTRLVEEPYVVATHGDDYGRWAARTGRFLPAVGRR